MLFFEFADLIRGKTGSSLSRCYGKEVFMKRCFQFFVSLILFLFAVQIDAQNQNQVDFPDVPRVSAYEAYVKYKDGKAIIIHAGGESFETRHIMGAINIPQEAVSQGKMKLPNFPKAGVEIFTYCY
jgi:hypothetical protein